MNKHDWTGVDLSVTRYPALRMQVRGPYACFTRPEASSERLSYPIMTPTAARGLLTSVFWKPEIAWRVEQIDVLAPVQWYNMRRNESGTAITAAMVKRGYLDMTEEIQQRMTTGLRDVHYRIHAHIIVHPDAREQDAAKWRDQFNRRINRGQTFRTPFLGMREMHADIVPVDDVPPIDWTQDLGIMLHSIHYGKQETYDWFPARVEQGRMTVPVQGMLAAANVLAVAR